MNALFVALLLAADPVPADAPKLENAIEVKPGEAVAFKGLCLPDALAISTAQRLVDAESRPGWPVVLGISGAAALVVGVVVGVAVYGLTAPKK